MTIGIIQHNSYQSPWTDKNMLEDALKRLTVDNIANHSLSFNFEYIIESNLTSVYQCFELLCEKLAPRNLHALLTTFDSHDSSQVLTQWSGLAGIQVIGASRSISFQNKVRITVI